MPHRRPGAATSTVIASLLLIAGHGTAADLPDLAGVAGADGGLVVLVDPASADDAVRIARGGRHLVALLEDQPEELAARQAALESATLVPVAQAHRWWFRDRLPFRARSVNVVVLRAGLDAKLLAEAERIVAPGHGVVLVEKDGAWEQRRVPRPAGMGVWQAYARDGSGSFFSPDTLLKEVDSIQFLCGGDRLRRHWLPYLADDRVLVQGIGRIEGRDAFTGVLRWSLPVEGVESNIALLSDRHYWYLTKANKGKKESTESKERKEIKGSAGMVLVGIDRLSGAEHRTLELGEFVPFRGQDNDSWTRFSRVVSDGKVIYSTGGLRRLLAHSAETGELLWQKEETSFIERLAVCDGLLVAMLCSTGDVPRERGFGWNCNVAEAVIGIDPKTGATRWRNDAVKGRPSENLVIDNEKVVACSFLPALGKPESRAEVEWYAKNLYLQVIERDSGATRFLRSDFTELTCARTNQFVGLWPGRIGVLKDNDVTLFDAKDGKVLLQVRGPGYHLVTPAVTATHLWAGNAAIPLDDSPALDLHGLDITFPCYYHRNAPANGMLYSPSHLTSVSSAVSVGSAAALCHRTVADRQPLPLDDARRVLKTGKATWSKPAPTDWPTFRGNSERGAWLDGNGPVPTRLAWSWKPSSTVAPEAAAQFQGGWRFHGNWVGPMSQPVADGTRVVTVQPAEGRVVCLDIRTGKESWSLRLGGRIDSPPTLAGATAFVGCDNGTVSAIDLTSGTLTWQFYAAAGADLIVDHDQVSSLYPATSSPVLHDGALFVAVGRHSRVELGVILWKLDPSTGRPLGRCVFDEAWHGTEEPRKRDTPKNGNRDSGPHLNTKTVVGDLLQIRDGRLALGRFVIDPSTMAVAPYPVSKTVQHITPCISGIAGGVRWIRPSAPLGGWQGYRMAGYQEVGGGGGADGRIISNSMLINRTLGLFAMTSRGFLTQIPLGFDISTDDLVKPNQTKLPTAEVPDYYATAARGDRFYFAVPTWADNCLHLQVVDRKATDKALADIAMDIKEEWPVADGIAVTGDTVIVTTSSGRLLAFTP